MSRHLPDDTRFPVALVNGNQKRVGIAHVSSDLEPAPCAEAPASVNR